MYETTHTPPIDVDTMTFFSDNFWCKIFRSTADRRGKLLRREDFRQSEVSELDVSLFVNDDILWLETG